jgi:hypothetical protein
VPSLLGTLDRLEEAGYLRRDGDWWTRR